MVVGMSKLAAIEQAKNAVRSMMILRGSLVAPERAKERIVPPARLNEITPIVWLDVA
jgi:hypothetical protein